MEKEKSGSVVSVGGGGGGGGNNQRNKGGSSPPPIKQWGHITGRGRRDSVDVEGTSGFSDFLDEADRLILDGAKGPVTIAIAKWAFEARNASEISFQPGTMIRVLEPHESGWWTGEINGAIGFFPVNRTDPQLLDVAAYQAEQKKLHSKQSFVPKAHSDVGAAPALPTTEQPLSKAAKLLGVTVGEAEVLSPRGGSVGPASDRAEDVVSPRKALAVMGFDEDEATAASVSRWLFAAFPLPLITCLLFVEESTQWISAPDENHGRFTTLYWVWGADPKRGLLVRKWERRILAQVTRPCIFSQGSRFSQHQRTPTERRLDQGSSGDPASRQGETGSTQRSGPPGTWNSVPCNAPCKYALNVVFGNHPPGARERCPSARFSCTK